MTVEQGAEAQGDSSAIDAALAGIGESPMPAAAESAPAAEAQAPVWNGSEWKFTGNGKEIVPESREKLLQWASQGHNYSQRMGDLNKTHAQRMAEADARDAHAKELEQKYSPFSQVEDFAQKNPGWWDHVQKSFHDREIPQGLDPQIAQVLSPLAEKVGSLEKFIQTQQELAQQAQQQQEFQKQDQALDAEVESIRKQYPNIDLSAPDESGESLERRVYKHAADNGIGTFRAAFRDLLFDQLSVQQSAQNRIQAVRSQQTQAKAGVLGQTQAPTKELKTVDVKRPWSDPAYDVQSILQEHRQINGG